MAIGVTTVLGVLYTGATTECGIETMLLVGFLLFRIVAKPVSLMDASGTADLGLAIDFSGDL